MNVVVAERNKNLDLFYAGQKLDCSPRELLNGAQKRQRYFGGVGVEYLVDSKSAVGEA